MSGAKQKLLILLTGVCALGLALPGSATAKNKPRNPMDYIMRMEKAVQNKWLPPVKKKLSPKVRVSAPAEPIEENSLASETPEVAVSPVAPAAKDDDVPVAVGDSGEMPLPLSLIHI